MKTQFCVVGATHGTGLLITQQLLQAGWRVRILARDPDKARRLLGNRAEIWRGDVTDAQSVGDAITEDCRAIFFTVAATGGVAPQRGLTNGRVAAPGGVVRQRVLLDPPKAWRPAPGPDPRVCRRCVRSRR